MGRDILMKKLIFGIPALFLILSAEGCASHYYGGGYGYRGGYGYARIAPPPPRAEVYGYAPGPDYVWMNGHWGWDGNRYNWSRGSWVRSRRRHARWEDGRWQRDCRGYRYRA